MPKGSVLVTGGTGYIGSFTVLALLEAGYDVVVVDSLYNSDAEVLRRIELICGRKPAFVNADITDEEALNRAFAAHPDVDTVIHFAALKAVGESALKPLDYWHVNVTGTIALLRAMAKHRVPNIVFSSSATVYGDASLHANMIPIPEHCPLAPTNPYGHTKAAVETLIGDWVVAMRTAATAEGSDPKLWNAGLLRYFNPAGAHPSGIMGEDPQGVPFNLLPLLAQVATGKREKLLVYGDDYPSKDGTAIRDYIHILDLAAGHLAAMQYLRAHRPGVRPWNLGTGTGSTVYDIVHAFNAAVGRDLPFQVVGRRAGDVLDLTSNPTRANKELGWSTRRTLQEACEHLWFWTRNNPDGYRGDAPRELLDALRRVDEAEGEVRVTNGC